MCDDNLVDSSRILKLDQGVVRRDFTEIMHRREWFIERVCMWKLEKEWDEVGGELILCIEGGWRVK